jgi:hypothetical protein
MSGSEKCRECGKEMLLGSSKQHPGLCYECATRKDSKLSAGATGAAASTSAESTSASESGEPAKLQLDQTQLRMLMNRLAGEERLAAGIAAGSAAAVVGAVVWAVITVVTGWQIGYMAVGIGFLVGISIRTVGKGLRKVFGIAGGLIAGIGCAFGNLLSICGFIASQQDMSIFDVIAQLDLQLAFDLMTAGFSIMDLAFYAIAIWAGYQYSFRRITADDIKRVQAGTPL